MSQLLEEQQSAQCRTVVKKKKSVAKSSARKSKPVTKKKTTEKAARKPATKANAKRKKLTTKTAVSFARDIRPMYTATDIAHMQFFCDLSSRADNQQHAQEILRRLKGQGGQIMPPPPAQPWTAQQIGRYQSWIDGGFQP
jgi:hypothetical protein